MELIRSHNPILHIHGYYPNIEEIVFGYVNPDATYENRLGREGMIAIFMSSVERLLVSTKIGINIRDSKSDKIH